MLILEGFFFDIMDQGIRVCRLMFKELQYVSEISIERNNIT